MTACSSRRLKRHELAYKRSLVWPKHFFHWKKNHKTSVQLMLEDWKSAAKMFFFHQKRSHKTSVQLMLEDWMCAAKMFFFTEKRSHKTSQHHCTNLYFLNPYWNLSQYLAATLKRNSSRCCGSNPSTKSFMWRFFLMCCDFLVVRSVGLAWRKSWFFEKGCWAPKSASR